MKYALAFSSVLVAATLQAADSVPGGAGGSIVVKIENFKDQSGDMICKLFNESKNFPKGQPLTSVTVKANEATHTCKFDALAAGEYAVIVVHDENSNGALDTNFIGIPKEGVGSSNNIRHKMGPPVYDESKIKLEGADLNISIKINY